MSAPRETVWKIDPHTVAKHAILERYYQAWLPILTSTFGPVLFIDGFAGPGIYESREPGSPLIVLKATLDHRMRITARVHFLFIEARKDRFESLQTQIATLRPLPENLSVEVHHGKFEEIESALDEIHARDRILVPTLAFIDPFGFTGFPMRLVEKLFRNPRAEVIITFIVRDLDRFAAFRESQVRELFGGSQWKKCLRLTPARVRRSCLVSKYREKLRYAGAKYTLAFELADENGNTIYYMIYGTTHRQGMRVMKNAMVYVDRTMNYRFADLVPFEQRRLIQFGLEETWIDEAGEKTWERFSGELVRVGEVDHFVTCDTMYPFRKKILKALLTRSPPALEYVDTPRQFGTFPKDSMRIRFHPKP